MESLVDVSISHPKVMNAVSLKALIKTTLISTFLKITTEGDGQWENSSILYCRKEILNWNRHTQTGI